MNNREQRDKEFKYECVQCGNLLYGWVKKTRQSTIELMPNKENAMPKGI